MKKKVYGIIQARTGSTRLPNKVLKLLGGKTVLTQVIERVKRASLLDGIIIATTEAQSDDPIVEEARKNNVLFYRGSEQDVLERYYFAAKEAKADSIVRMTSDCPLIDANLINQVVQSYLDGSYDITTNAGIILEKRSFPRGLDATAFSFSFLEEAYYYAKEKYEREHVTPYLFSHTKNIFWLQNTENYSHYRWTLDTEEDFLFIKQIYHFLYNGEHTFGYKEIMNLLKEQPQLLDINCNVQQKKIHS